MLKNVRRNIKKATRKFDRFAVGFSNFGSRLWGAKLYKGKNRRR